MPRLIILLLLFGMSLFCVIQAFTYHLWYVAIMVTEFPWIFILIELLLLVGGFAPQRFQTMGNVIAIVSIALFASPIIRAYTVSQHLPEELVHAFGGTARNDLPKSPFQMSRMLTGIMAKTVSSQTLVYSNHPDGLALALDFYPAQVKGLRPCVIVVHGGSWAGGDNKQLPELNSHLALKGYHVAAINYRLAPKYKSPAPVADIYAALHYLKTHAADLRIDTQHFVLLGRSAGAQLVLVAAYAQQDPDIKGVINFYGPADMVWGYAQPANKWVFDSKKVMEDFLNGTYAQVPAQYAASSAVELVSPHTPPTLMIHGQNDVLVAYEHELRLGKKLQANGIPHYLLTLPWATHGCDYTLNGPSGQLSTYAVDYFLSQVAP